MNPAPRLKPVYTGMGQISDKDTEVMKEGES